MLQHYSGLGQEIEKCYCGDAVKIKDVADVGNVGIIKDELGKLRKTMNVKHSITSQDQGILGISFQFKVGILRV